MDRQEVVAWVAGEAARVERERYRWIAYGLSGLGIAAALAVYAVARVGTPTDLAVPAALGAGFAIYALVIGPLSWAVMSEGGRESDAAPANGDHPLLYAWLNPRVYVMWGLAVAILLLPSRTSAAAFVLLTGIGIVVLSSEVVGTTSAFGAWSSRFSRNQVTVAALAAGPLLILIVALAFVGSNALTGEAGMGGLAVGLIPPVALGAIGFLRRGAFDRTALLLREVHRRLVVGEMATTEVADLCRRLTTVVGPVHVATIEDLIDGERAPDGEQADPEPLDDVFESREGSA